MEKGKYAFVSALLLVVAIINMSVLVLTGCGPQTPPDTTSLMSQNYYRVVATDDTKDDYKVVVIDGCQYLYQYSGHGASMLTHKGNCTNVIHYRYNVEAK